jgi:acyl-CoA dehydrogenase
MVELFATPKLKRLYEATEAFLEAEIWPHEQRWLHTPFRQVEAEVRGLREKARQTGAWNPHLPEAVGGAGLSLPEFGQLSELLGRSPFGHLAFNCQAPDAGNIELLLHHASPTQREQWLQPLLAGDIRSCFAMTEPEYAGSNPVRLGTTARREGSEYILDGHKWFTTAADGAAFAIVMAVTNPDTPNLYQRASMIIVPTDCPGFKLVRNIPVMGHAGEGWHSHAEIRLENVRVPLANLIGPEGAGFALAQERLGPGRIHHCMRWIGICERSFELMCQRAATRELAEGRLLGQQQLVQAMIAENRARIDAARYLVLHTALKIEQAGQRAARTDISAIKFLVAGVLQQVVDCAIQVHGALGVTDDTILAHFYREERAARIYDGPDEVHKLSLAKQILKGYGL